jgi:hypothetical protein
MTTVTGNLEQAHPMATTAHVLFVAKPPANRARLLRLLVDRGFAVEIASPEHVERRLTGPRWIILDASAAQACQVLRDLKASTPIARLGPIEPTSPDTGAAESNVDVIPDHDYAVVQWLLATTGAPKHMETR